jgi:phosphotriesterase-related protein
MGPDQAEFLISRGADPAKIMIGHMSDNLDLDYQQKTLDQGVYVSWDRMGLQGLVGCPMDEQRYEAIATLVKKGYASQLMLSHDSIIRWLGRPLNIPEEAFPLIANWNQTHLFKNIIPALKDAGVTEDQIQTMIQGNPADLFSAKS